MNGKYVNENREMPENNETCANMSSTNQTRQINGEDTGVKEVIGGKIPKFVES